MSGSACRAIRRNAGDATTEHQLSKRIDRSWLVVSSVENFEHNRCVDVFSRRDGSYGFEEFRRDAEDGGEWTPIQYYSGFVYVSPEATLSAAMQSVVWLTEDVVRQTPSLRKYLSQNSN
jgi:hypothetical protein